MSTTASPALPGTRHKVIGLVSGGKDSCFNLMHTLANGHEVVAIATLTPPPSIGDELDSHMYQSVGTQIPRLIAQSMGLPYYSRVITGGALEQGAEYGSREGKDGREGDETEDLTALLLQVLASHPDATAISSGAILSNYQRLRIEHVCSRLKLTSLAYLWQSKQLPLVTQMVASGLTAVLVKVAGAGLNERHLAKSLGQLLPVLTRLEMQYGAHPAGEGGEYETVTLDAPIFSHRIELGDPEVVITDPEPYTVAYLRIEDAQLVPKEGWTKPSVAELRELLGLDEVEGGLDEQGHEVLETVEMKVAPGDSEVFEDIAASEPGVVRFGRTGRWFSVSGEGKAADSVGGELVQAFEAITARLATENLTVLHATHITLLLSNMADFPLVNAAYIRYFGTSPPSRACVAVPLPAGQRLRVDMVGFDDSGDTPVGGRSALHVQGISYWAPANIGPYSQAVTVDARLHIAGQIPLLPPTLTFAPYPAPPASPYAQQAALALQHVRRIVEVLRNPASTGGGWTGWPESCVAWWAQLEGCGTEGPEVSRKAWTKWLALNEWNNNTPVILARASALPRGALIEYQVNLHTGRAGYTDTVHEGASDDDDDDDLDDSQLHATYESGTARGAFWQTCTAPRGRHGSRAAIFLPSTDSTLLAAAPALAGVLRRAVSVRVYHLVSVVPSVGLVREASERGVGVSYVPVLEVRSGHGTSYPLAIEVFSA